jgi:hypothetical protein
MANAAKSEFLDSIQTGIAAGAGGSAGEMAAEKRGRRRTE